MEGLGAAQGTIVVLLDIAPAEGRQRPLVTLRQPGWRATIDKCLFFLPPSPKAILMHGDACGPRADLLVIGNFAGHFVNGAPTTVRPAVRPA